MTQTSQHPEIYSSAASARDLLVPTQNLTLASLPHNDLVDLLAAMRPVRLDVNDLIYPEDEHINFLYFPISCVVSAIAIMEDGTSIEIWMTGREGIVGVPAVIGRGRSQHFTRVLAGGMALRISACELQKRFNSSSVITQALLRAYRSLFTQISQRSVCNGRHRLLQRLCIWLLMMQDRLGSKELPFTQDEIAKLIAVRRASITDAATWLKKVGGISYQRGGIVIRNSAELEKLACECQHILRADFRHAQS